MNLNGTMQHFKIEHPKDGYVKEINKELTGIYADYIEGKVEWAKDAYKEHSNTSVFHGVSYALSMGTDMLATNACVNANFSDPVTSAIGTATGAFTYFGLMGGSLFMKYKLRANVELDCFEILMELETTEDIDDLVDIARKELNKNLGCVKVRITVKNLICFMGGK